MQPMPACAACTQNACMRRMQAHAAHAQAACAACTLHAPHAQKNSTYKLPRVYIEIQSLHRNSDFTSKFVRACSLACGACPACMRRMHRLHAAHAAVHAATEFRCKPTHSGPSKTSTVRFYPQNFRVHAPHARPHAAHAPEFWLHAPHAGACNEKL